MRRLAAALTVVLAVIAALCTAALPAHAAPTTYFVDASNGSDSNNGTSEGTPWRSLAKVNATTFAPGDTIRFRSGGSWDGQLWPKGSGTGAAHIAIDRYGSGAKPRINGNGAMEGAVRLLNQPYWEIRNLEVTNTRGDGSRAQFVGIKVRNDTGGPLNGVYITGNTVHDVPGIQAGFYGRNGGIAVVADMGGSTWHEVRIENNSVYAVDRVGIFVGPAVQLGKSPDWQRERRSTSVVIQNNIVDDSGGDGILNFITADVLVQHNVVANTGSRSINPGADGDYENPAAAGIWSASSERTTIQYNEVYNDRAVLDGQGYDIDLGSHATYIQYNYSHNNLGGFLLLCEIPDAGVDINDARVRFNVSQNDLGGVVTLCRDQPKGPDPADIMNNTIYLPPGSQTAMFRRNFGTAAAGTLYVYNNIFYTLGTSSYLPMPGAVYDYNVYYGRHHPSEPADSHKLTSDPKLAAPGSGYFGRDSVDGYKLVAGSPAIGSGTNTGVLGPADYWGNPVGPAAPSRGAYNGPGVAAPTPNHAFNAAVSTSSSVECCAYFRSKLVDGSRNSISTETGGFSSALGNFSQHEEWIVLKFPGQRSFSQVVLYPRNEPGMVGRGFPQHFHIQVWNGFEWLTRKTVSNAGAPSTPQVYRWEGADFTDQVRIITARTNNVPDGLQLTPEGYALQLAEIEVNP